MQNKVFKKPSGENINISKIISEISNFVEDEPGSLYRVVIGTDSQEKRTNGNGHIDFVSAIIVHRIGKGAKYYWRKEKKIRKPVLRDKIYTETLMSLDLAQNMVPKLRNKVSPAKYDLEIHIDVGALGPTRDMIKEVVGMVNGNGFTAKTKPESWGASSVADKHT